MTAGEAAILFLLCLVLTEILELGTAFLLGVRDKYDFAIIALANVLTNPALNVILAFFASLTPVPIWLPFAVLEILVVLVEGAVYKKYLDFRKVPPYLLSLILNVVSLFIGSPLVYLIVNR